ncbi:MULTISPECIES: hypothetical protein [Methylobacillus]|uniref:Uncharacterized protein n=1 Tax=Methylobacillus flagellatus (strain ATCC 51484 / DSM 6875 / VKM B-1610 / KT) TaxID=265072 RepID=Q1H1C9_METFK|nr:MULTISPECIES: hypothetical protein [Methylobacillus]ABE49708.1 hypothetical protein Mfla_1440 [Methylobacillus flagellatus KT]MPS49055.1 hypothetical protein [Methylobacillus sp.]
MARVDEFNLSSPLHRAETMAEGHGFVIRPVNDSFHALQDFQKIVMAVFGSMGNDYGIETSRLPNGMIDKIVCRQITY